MFIETLIFSIICTLAGLKSIHFSVTKIRWTPEDRMLTLLIGCMLTLLGGTQFGRLIF